MIDTQAIRNKILDLAMRGQLTEQLPEDGTAEELFQKIQAEKQALIKAGKIKKDKLLPEIISDDVPFEIPGNWKWIRFAEICSIINGDRGKNYPAKSTLKHEGIPFISALNLNGIGVTKDENLLCLDEHQYALLGNGKLQKDDIVICIRGSLGKHGRYPFEQGAIASSLVISRLFYPNRVLGDFEMAWLDSPVFPTEIQKYNNGTAQPNLAANNLEKFLFPLPPLAEQQRIVDKIDQAFSILDTIDELQTQYVDNLSTLKAKLIDAAIQGKLTEQLPEDGTAQELYEKIQEEKQALIKAGKIKKKKPQPEIYDNEFPFDIPSNWKWVPLGELISIESGRGLTAVEMKPGRIPVYGGNGITGHHDCGFVPEGTVVIGRVGYYCGSVHVTEQEAWVTDNAFITIYPEQCLDKWFLVHTLRHMKLGQNNNGSAQPVVSGKKIYPLAFPLPPLAEQMRIAARIEEILPMCEG